MAMMVVITEGIPLRLRGRLSVWMIEIRAGVYLGNLSNRTREMIWGLLVQGAEDGSVAMAWASPNEAGYDFLTLGKNRREPVDYDGLRLVAFAPPPLPID